MVYAGLYVCCIDSRVLSYRSTIEYIFNTTALTQKHKTNVDQTKSMLIFAEFS